MRKPKERLDDFIVDRNREVTVEPPTEVCLQLTGEVEILKPLAHQELATPALARPSIAIHQPLWFRALLAGGSGALVMTAFVLISAIFIGITEPPAGAEVAANEQPADKLTRTEERFGLDIFSPSSLAPVTDGFGIVRSKVRRRSARPAVHLAAYRSRELRPLPQPEEPKFVPTTLVIYAENGVINSRIEPWFQSGDKRLPTLNN